MGYKEGFSLGSILYDFRRFVTTNEFEIKDFRFQIENLYNITGKKVIIIAHSFGTLNTLNNLIYKENKDLIPNIKKFIAMNFFMDLKILILFTSFHKFVNF